jgi:GST-like protein
MIELHYWPTPNGHKITMFLEETGLEYRIVPVSIGTGAQFEPAFLAIAPNNRMPAIVDTEPRGGGGPLSVFESGAILLYLAEKSGRLLPAGQNHHFARYAPEKLPYAITRYVNETNRLYGVLNTRLADRRFIAGEEYSIADIASYPWIVPHEAQGQRLEDFPHLQRWFEAIRARPATERAYDKGKAISTATTLTEEAKKILFGQTAR